MSAFADILAKSAIDDKGKSQRSPTFANVSNGRHQREPIRSQSSKLYRKGHPWNMAEKSGTRELVEPENSMGKLRLLHGFRSFSLRAIWETRMISFATSRPSSMPVPAGRPTSTCWAQN